MDVIDGAYHRGGYTVSEQCRLLILGTTAHLDQLYNAAENRGFVPLLRDLVDYKRQYAELLGKLHKAIDICSAALAWGNRRLAEHQQMLCDGIDRVVGLQAAGNWAGARDQTRLNMISRDQVDYHLRLCQRNVHGLAQCERIFFRMATQIKTGADLSVAEYLVRL